MKKKIISTIIILSIIVICIVINDNVVDKSKIINYNGNNLLVTIDGETLDSLPSSGNYYLTDYDCDNPKTKVTWNRTSYELDISNGTSKGGVYCNLTFKSKPLLSEMPVGSYVAYTGKGGTVGSTSVECSGDACSGVNANQESDTSGYTYGYCSSASYRYYTTGWRIAYIKDNKAMLVSAGAPECASRTSSNANVTYINTANALALKYCNSDYVDGSCACISTTSGQCDNASTDAWAINDYDFYYMTKAISGVGKRLADDSNANDDSLGDTTGGTLTTAYCIDKYSYKECGYNNDLIDIGGYYYFASRYTSSSSNSTTYKYGMYWYPYYRAIKYASSTSSHGLRPVISLSSSVYVTGGDGTMTSPYTIGTTKPRLLSTASVGSYVAYTGNNGCTGDYCSGTNANSSDTSNGYCYGSIFQFNSSGWRVVYTKEGSAYLISAGAPECISDSSLSVSELDELAIKYCNTSYSYEGICNTTTVWAMDNNDFYEITGYNLTDDACYGSGATTNCNLGNDLISNGGIYLFATNNTTDSNTGTNYTYNVLFKSNYLTSAENNSGFRPVIKLDPTIVITGGTGTSDDPYQIAKP